jgi:hypothetical protein
MAADERTSLFAERLYWALAFPKLYVVTLNKLLGMFCGQFFIWTNKSDCPNDVAILAENIRAKFWRVVAPNPGLVSSSWVAFTGAD